MPLYEYQCLPEGHRFEARHGFNDEPVRTCPECGAPVRRIIHPVGVVFKGTGFYVTDSRKSESGTKSSSTKSKNGESGGDSKSESKTEQKSESAPS